MTEHDDKRGGSGCPIGCLLMFVLFLPLYVSSIGPVVWVCDRNPSLQWLAFIYAPLGLLAAYCEPFGRFLQWYMICVMTFSPRRSRRSGLG